MPRLDVHLCFGVLAALLIDSSLVFATLESGSPDSIPEILHGIFMPLIFVSLFLLAGSVLPDIDGRGKIRWIIGPMAGSFAFFPPFLARISGDGFEGGVSFFTGDGSALFLIFTILGYLFLLAPMKHRGLMHDWRGAGIFGSVVFVYVLTTSPFGLDQSLLVGAMALIGYLWHLALDGKLF